MFSIALGLTTLSACDKPKDADQAGAKTDDQADAKADAKKAGDEEVAANTDPAAPANPEEGCIHEDKPANHADHAEGEGCDHGGAAAPTESTGHFGAAFALTDAQPLSTALASGVPTAAVKVSGTVESVCQAKGCWMVIKDGDVTARVLVKDHAFAIPMDGKGKSATVEGTLEAKELTEANVAHLKKDGDANLEGDEARQEFFLHATAVELAANS
jgi:hypothetical protein